MATQSMAYDHSVYQQRVVLSGMSTAGANGVTTKFAAFTAMQIKSVTQGPVISSTAAGSQPLLFSKSGTTTSTTTLTVLTSGASAAINNAVAVTLAQGDQFWYTHGTDATATVAVAVECVVTPGATVTT